MLAQRLFVEKAGLPSPLLNAIKRLAAFQNPEFYQIRSRACMRLSTSVSLRVIACAEEFPQHIFLPRGCQADLEAFLKGHGVALVVDDRRYEGEAIVCEFRGGTDCRRRRRRGRFCSMTSACLSRHRASARRCTAHTSSASEAGARLVLVHRRPLLDQWVTHLSIFPNVWYDMSLMNPIINRGLHQRMLEVLDTVPISKNSLWL